MEINLPNGANVEEIVLPDGSNASEVIGPDGSSIWNAIPDSEANQKLIHRWVLNDVASGTVTDTIGSADGTNNGVTSVSGDWAGGSAGDGDGIDDNIETTTWGDFGSSTNTNFAIAFSVQTTSTGRVFGVRNTGSSWMGMLAGNTGLADIPEGHIGFLLRSVADSGDFNIVGGSSDIRDGSPYRVVINKTGNTASDIDIWLNQTDDNATVENDAFDETNVEDFDTPITQFAWSDQGTPSDYWDGIIDDICAFEDSLTQSEIESYDNPWDA